MKLFHLNRLGVRGRALSSTTFRRDYSCSEVGTAWGPVSRLEQPRENGGPTWEH